MLASRSRPRIWLAAVFVLAAGRILVATAVAAEAEKPAGKLAKVDPAELVKAGRKTLQRLEKEAASWTASQELRPGMYFTLKVVRTPRMRRITVFLPAEEPTRLAKLLAEILERDGRWYVRDDAGYRIYRPYELPFPLTALYLMLDLAEIRVVTEPVAAGLGSPESVFGNVATYSRPLPGRLSPELADASTRARLEKMSGLLDARRSIRVDTSTGILVERGNGQKRFHIEDLRWHESLPADTFDTAGRRWKDFTAALSDGDDRNLVLFGHSPLWRPGQPAGDLALVLVQRKTGEIRRVPYRHGLASFGCFSADRRKVYACGHVADEGSIGLFEIDLQTGANRRLGGEALASGVTLSPVLSPDGRTLAVSHLDIKDIRLESQLFLVDVAAGSAKPLGTPRDAAFFSWLPDGKGLVFRWHQGTKPDQPQVDTVCRMDLEGRVTRLRPGDSPVVLAPRLRILFRDAEGQRWKTCDLDGKDAELVGDGLEGFGFASQSPDGRRLVMMKFGGPKGPRPYLVDVTTGQAEPIPVGDGLWAVPAW